MVCGAVIGVCGAALLYNVYALWGVATAPPTAVTTPDVGRVTRRDAPAAPLTPSQPPSVRGGDAAGGTRKGVDTGVSGGAPARGDGGVGGAGGVGGGGGAAAAGAGRKSRREVLAPSPPPKVVAADRDGIDRDWVSGVALLCKQWRSGGVVTSEQLAAATGSSPQCSPLRLSERLQPLSKHAPVVDATNASSVLAVLCPPEPPSLDVDVDPSLLPPSTAVLPAERARGRVFLWTSTSATGIAESFAQLWRELKALGFDVTVVATEVGTLGDEMMPGTPPAELRDQYGSPSTAMNFDDAGPGDILISRHDLIEGCWQFRKLRKRGVRVYVWLLGVSDEYPIFRPECTFIAHSHFSVSAARLPTHAVLQPYLRPDVFPECSKGSLLEQVVVVVDDDAMEADALASLRSVLSSRHGVAFVNRASGRDHTSHLSMLASSRVFVDAGMGGVERSLLEAAACGVVPVVSDERVGGDRTDVPLPWSLVYPADASQDVLASRIGAAVECRADLTPLLSPLVSHARSLPSRFTASVQRLFANDVHAMAMVCDGTESLSLAWAASVLAMLPLASVELFVTRPAEFTASFTSQLQVFGGHYTRANVIVSQMARASTCSARAVVGQTPSDVSNGRLLLFGTVDEVLVVPNLVTAPMPAEVLGDEQLTWQEDSGAVFAIVKRTSTVSYQGRCVGGETDGGGGGGGGGVRGAAPVDAPLSTRRCEVLLNDPSNAAGLRAFVTVASGAAWHDSDAADPGAREDAGDVAALCAQPLWQDMEAALAGAIQPLCPRVETTDDLE